MAPGSRPGLHCGPGALFAQSPSAKAQKIYAKLQKCVPSAELEITLRNHDRIQGRLASFDQTVLRLDELPNPIPLEDIAKVKNCTPRGQGPRWNLATGFIQSWKSAAIVGGLLVVLVILVATNRA